MAPTVVVGLGGSGGWHALSWATDEVAVTGSRLLLCHAYPPGSALAESRSTTPIAHLELVDPPLARAIATARTRLGGDRVTLRLRPGRPGPLLVEAAAEADLVVVGQPGGRSHGGWGSTTHYVAAHAPCPVVVVRPVAGAARAPFAGHVVIGVDGPAAERALEFGFGYADAHRRPVAAVHVTPMRAEDFWFDEATLSTHLTAEPTGLDLLSELVEPWLRKYPHVPVKRAVYAGAALPGLVRAAEGAGLLVVGDHGRGAAARALLGSVSHTVIDRAGCSVALVRGYERRGGPSIGLAPAGPRSQRTADRRPC